MLEFIHSLGMNQNYVIAMSSGEIFRLRLLQIMAAVNILVCVFWGKHMSISIWSTGLTVELLGQTVDFHYSQNLSYKVTANTELSNTETLLLGEIQG